MGINLELLSYWRLILQNRFVIGVCLLLGVFGSYFKYSTEISLFQASSQVFVSTPATALDISALATGSNFSQQRVKSYAQIINSPLTLQGVVNQLHLKMSTEELSSKISAVAPADTVLITISVTDSNASRAADIANATADEFGKYVGALENRSDDSATPIKVSVVRRAVVPGAPFSPVKSIYLLLGLLFGFAVGLAIALTRKLLDSSIKNEDDLLGLPLLAAISYDPDAEEKPLISKLSRYALRTEAFRTLRTNIKYIIPNAPAKVVAVTSALPTEGKSTTATNLCISLAQGGARVVLVEGDMRRPSIANYLELNSKKNGLSQVLASETALTIRKVKSDIDKTEIRGLEVLTAGPVPGNPSELLGSGNFIDLVSLLRKNYEYVIIDSPPLLPVTDAAIISTISDGVLLVVHAGKTRKAELMGSRAAVESIGSKILGVVLNKIPAEKRSSQYGYRYGYSYGYGKSSSSRNENVYPPSPDEIYRLEREEFFDRIAGKKFKDELRSESAKYDTE